MLIFRRTIVLVQHLVSSLPLGDRSDHRLREVLSIYLVDVNQDNPTSSAFRVPWTHEKN